MAWPNSVVRNFKNFEIMQLELSPNPAMILVPDFFVTRLLGTIYWLPLRDKKRLIWNKCINNLAPAYLCYLFAPRTLFSQREEKNNDPKTKNWLPEV